MPSPGISISSRTPLSSGVRDRRASGRCVLLVVAASAGLRSRRCAAARLTGAMPATGQPGPLRPAACRDRRCAAPGPAARPAPRDAADQQPKGTGRGRSSLALAVRASFIVNVAASPATCPRCWVHSRRLRLREGRRAMAGGGVDGLVLGRAPVPGVPCAHRQASRAQPTGEPLVVEDSGQCGG